MSRDEQQQYLLNQISEGITTKQRFKNEIRLIKEGRRHGSLSAVEKNVRRVNKALAYYYNELNKLLTHGKAHGNAAPANLENACPEGAPLHEDVIDQGRTPNAKPGITRTTILPKQKCADLSDIPGIETLTQKQLEVLSLKVEYGFKPTQIAKHLGLHRKTVDEHLKAAEKRLDQYRDNRSKRHLTGKDEEDRMIKRIEKQ